ncbi:Probable ribose-5-phosphate isomerase B [Raoultella terrigena]|uniref:Probable ribose-5-phosphate isomerase B n=1 Tax=Raoultella terrigena TaxID=577 RepID=A0A4U9D1J0_RAOTE|nr:Probable ribose-5-phosphate isomerase B [Raoultella terrigena]
MRRSHLDRREQIIQVEGIEEFLINHHRAIFSAIVERDENKADELLGRHFEIGSDFRPSRHHPQGQQRFIDLHYSVKGKQQMQIVIGSDHAGFHLKQELKQWLHQAGYQIDDVGSHDPEPVDFPDIALALCSKVRGSADRRGILVCGTGVGRLSPLTKSKGSARRSAMTCTPRTSRWSMTTSTSCAWGRKLSGRGLLAI